MAKKRKTSRDKFRKGRKRAEARAKKAAEDATSKGSSYILNQGKSFWKPTVKKITKLGLDLVPFLVPSDGAVKVWNVKGKQWTELDKDEVAYKLDIFVHYGIGPDDRAFICPKSMSGDPCPICETREEFTKGSDEFKALSPKHRVLYNVYDPMDDDEGVQLFECSYYNFEEDLLVASETEDEAGGDINFFDPDEGYRLRFLVDPNATFPGGTYTKYTSFSFQKRQPLDDKLLDGALDLSEAIRIPTYKEIAAVHQGIDADDIDEDPETEEEEIEEEYEDEDEETEDEDGDEEFECPGEIGKDIDELEDCDTDCPLREECEDMAEEIEKKKKKKKVKKKGKK